MPLEEVMQFLRRSPFVPFRVYVTDGAAYDVRHPELVLPGARFVEIGIAADPNQMYFDRVVSVDLLHITRLEPMSAVPSGVNGQQP